MGFIFWKVAELDGGTAKEATEGRGRGDVVILCVGFFLLRNLLLPS